jgi:hypothetical protein
MSIFSCVFFINFLCIHGHYNGEHNWQNIMSITGYVIALILMFIFKKLNPYNQFDFLKCLVGPVA